MQICSNSLILPELFHFPYFYDNEISNEENVSLNLAFCVKSATNDSPLMQYEFKILGFSVKCCLDTGASTVFFRQALINDFISKGCDLHVQTLRECVNVTLGDNKEIQCRFKVVLPLEIEGNILSTDALILSDLPFDVIIGMSFLKRNNVLIHPATKSLVIDSDYGLNDSTSFFERNSFLYLNENIFIPPCSEMIVETKCNNINIRKAFARNYKPLTERACIFSAKGLIENSGGVIPIVLGNLSNKSCSLPRGTIVSLLEYTDNQWSEYINILSEDSNNNTFPGENSTKEDVSFPDELDWSNTNLDPLQLEEVKQLVKKFSNLFMKSKNGVGTTNCVSHSIDTGEALPVNQPPYRAGYKERQVIEDQVKDLLDRKLIQPSSSPWASPVVLVNKKDGSVRFCIDYRKLNQITIKDVYPLPRIDDCLNALGNAQYFSTFDLASGYWQIPMNEKDREKTAFISHCGLYEFSVMPFGLCNAPATFQRYMDQCFAGLKWISCLIYLDDIIVFSSTFDQHLNDLEEVFKRLQVAGLTLKPSKCFICREKLIYLGHEVSALGIKPDPNKVQAVQKIKTPTNKTELRCFLGLCSYYRKFIKNFAKIAAPLHQLTHDGVLFKWKKIHQDAFEKLKLYLVTAPILSHPNFEYPFIIQTDASIESIGAVWCQKIEERERCLRDACAR